ncbi:MULTISPECIES: zinc-dependent alcohol dehydrogenase family protein [unclassified Pseudomonas]|uniref:zinc-dependent alcohol dehydrogenase family protein n=1 Tax=unclassified Pseudomonas TaxID=196821 RepID=UPI002AC958AC|nr:MULTISPECIES: zinc-dependent alcohol dehydrogenase family protein [unclassified Pseudomonas]MEB0039902.1 zinc-dependent alcohol dehydrogenase family protein [Pseudomonas sp. MH10]MEB0077157.1 zinc-dependent alcohol dehydrogenase family protein [Pseudomonas sp. MH10out]MEB0093045.1 zinc-dependent alcohol dehydrogenase family protein [Pseudomonas sp. CCI4.2]MEB0102248.1 zinc-dependent alcohol dehydrogenase family protein [Pseudomonas sp. CCI3.2]MEB0123536.1 zinc-dependent alcohol dehydrogenas
MKSFVFRATGEPSEVLALEEVPLALPGPGEVRVRVHLAPVHPGDLHVLRGKFGRQPVLPASPGLECMGTVDALGAGVVSPAIGTRVIPLNVPGTWQVFIVVPADRLVVVPDTISDNDAAQAMINPFTALALTRHLRGLKANDWLVQTAAGSTVGRLILQLARSEGFRTINLVRREEQMAEIIALGGDVVICTDDDNWPQQLLAATDGKGASFAIDSVAGSVGATIARNMAAGGHMLVYGALSSHRQTEPSAFQLPLFTPQLIYKSITVEGWYLFHWLAVAPLEDTRSLLEDVLNRMATGRLELPAAKRHSINDIRQALIDAGSSAREGKPLLEFFNSGYQPAPRENS